MSTEHPPRAERNVNLSPSLVTSSPSFAPPHRTARQTARPPHYTGCLGGRARDLWEVVCKLARFHSRGCQPAPPPSKPECGHRRSGTSQSNESRCLSIGATVSVHHSRCPSITAGVHPSERVSVHWSQCPSMRASVHPSERVSVHRSRCLSITAGVRPSEQVSVHRSQCLSIGAGVCPSQQVSVHHSRCPSIRAGAQWSRPRQRWNRGCEEETGWLEGRAACLENHHSFVLFCSVFRVESVSTYTGWERDLEG